MSVLAILWVNLLLILVIAAGGQSPDSSLHNLYLALSGREQDKIVRTLPGPQRTNGQTR